MSDKCPFCGADERVKGTYSAWNVLYKCGTGLATVRAIEEAFRGDGCYEAELAALKGWVREAVVLIAPIQTLYKMVGPSDAPNDYDPTLLECIIESTYEKFQALLDREEIKTLREERK